MSLGAMMHRNLVSHEDRIQFLTLILEISNLYADRRAGKKKEDCKQGNQQEAASGYLVNFTIDECAISLLNKNNLLSNVKERIYCKGKSHRS